MKTLAQKEAMIAIKNLVDTDFDLYQTRHNFRLEPNEIVHVRHRITLAFNEQVVYNETDDCGEEYTYTEDREEEFFYHVWFNREGHIWYLITDDMFPVFGKDIQYWGRDEDYDYETCGRGSRRYFFYDIISTYVPKAFESRIKDLKRFFVWNRAEVDVFKYEVTGDDY